MASKKMLFVTTKKIKIHKGYHYYIIVSDGENSASFINHGRDKITFSDLCSADNKYKTRFDRDRSNNTLYRMPGWGTRKEVTYKQQVADMMQFVNEVLERDINIVYRDNDVLTYTVSD